LDTLTGLLNRKTFESHFHKRCQRLAPPELPAHSLTKRRSVDMREPSWLAIVDIDHFKAINDGFGHLFGDEVLLLASRLMRRSLRGADQLFRFGGEEFVVVLDHESESGVEIVFERLRATVEQHLFPQVGRVTISIGYTCITTSDVGANAFGRADEALYLAKQQGRNRLLSYESLAAQSAVGGKTQEAAEIELF
jgi:diguanylate cyclase (GGDEF)-like protein